MASIRANVCRMDGIHDLGGMDGFGPVVVEADEPYFHEDWERRALRLAMATFIGLQAGGPAFRHSMERMDPAHYLSASYYERWLTGVGTLAVEAGVTSADDLARRAGGPFPLARGAAVPPPPVGAEDRTTPRFAVDDRVRVRDWHSPGHTRLPRYVRGRRGVIDRVDAPANFPDDEFAGVSVRDPLYSVRFSGDELWGSSGSGVTVNVDLSERYLEACDD